MTQLYIKNYPADFPALVSSEPNGSDLGITIKYSGISETLEYLTVGSPANQCTFAFVNPLSPGDEATFDAIIATHTGIAAVTSMKASQQIASEEKAITEDITWQKLAEFVTTPSFFTEDITQLLGRIVGEYKATAGGGGELPQLSVVEKVAGEADQDILPPYDMTAEASFVTFGVSTTNPVRDGYHNIYCVMGRLNGAASFSIQWTTISMLDAKVMAF